MNIYSLGLTAVSPVETPTTNPDLPRLISGSNPLTVGRWGRKKNVRRVSDAYLLDFQSFWLIRKKTIERYSTQKKPRVLHEMHFSL